MARRLLVTIDTEVDKDARWRIANPVSFRSIVDAVPNVFEPLFTRHGVRPTYFLSPEVIENEACAGVLAGLGDRVELATHLHAEFVAPDRRLFVETMAGEPADAIQKQYSRAVEAAKLATLTDMFRTTFGRAPMAFRAGRYGASEHTFEILAQLGYRVDSSVTPGLHWKYAEGELDYRAWRPEPRWIDTRAGRLLELPLSIQPRWPLGMTAARFLPSIARVVPRVLGDSRAFTWLRPSWLSGTDLISYVERSDERILVLMLHSIEGVAGASPYAATNDDVRRIMSAMDELFSHCRKTGIEFSTATEAAAYA